jgi:hypothetical protein
MGKYMLVVASSAKPGREEEYADWYVNVHMPDVCSAAGVKSGRRIVAMSDSPMPTPGSQLAIYELDVDHPGSVIAEIQKRTAAGEFAMTDSIDSATVKIWFYEAD